MKLLKDIRKIFQRTGVSGTNISLQTMWRMFVWTLLCSVVLLLAFDAYVFTVYGVGWEKGVADVTVKEVSIHEDLLRSAEEELQHRKTQYEKIMEEGISIKNPFQLEETRPQIAPNN